MKRALLGLFVLGCGTTGGTDVRFPWMAGAATEDRTFEDDGWTVTVEEALVAFGPVYFCATPSADLELCPSAIAEVRGAVTVDALDASAPALGEVHALTGTVRSVMWDYGRPFLLSAAEPAPIDGAIDGHSARFVATAVRGADTFHVVVDLDVEAQLSGISAVRAVRTDHAIVDERDGLTVRFDVPQILSHLDWDALFAASTAGEVRIVPGTAAYDQLVVALTTSTLPTLVWARAD